MIRFSCPACHKVLKAPDHGGGRKINCPKCGQRMLIPMPAKPAAANPTVLGQLTSSPLPGPVPSTCTEADSLVLLGLRKDAELEGKSEEQSAKPTRSWAGTLCAFLALTLAVAAMPVAVIHHPLPGVGLAASGIVLALVAVFKSLFRRGLGLAAVALMVGGSVLFSIVFLAGGPEGLLRPVKDRLAALSQHDSQGQSEEHSYRPKTSENGAEPKSEANQTEPNLTDAERQKKGASKRRTQRHEEEETPAESAPKRQTQRREEKAEEQQTQPEQEPAPAKEKTPAKKGPKLDEDEILELNRWVENLRTELGDPRDNPIRYRTLLQKMKEKARAYTREFTARKVYLDFTLPIVRIEEDGVYLGGLHISKGAGKIDSQDHKGTSTSDHARARGESLLLKVDHDISKETVLELKRGQYLHVRADVVEVSVEGEAATTRYRYPDVKITVKNLRLREKNEKSGQESGSEAKRKKEKPEPEDDGRSRFDPNDLQRTARWGWAIVERLQQDADNAIRYRATLEKLQKDISVHENAKVRWVFVVVVIKEDSVELWADRRSGNFIGSRTGSLSVTDNRGFGSLSLNVGQGISKEKAAKLKPGDTITISAKVAKLTLEGGSITVVLKDLQVAEARN